MDIAGIGTEIVECVRIGRLIEQHGDLFLARIYTEAEIRDCQQKRKSLEHFACYWAAKEAVLKALGTGWRQGLSFTDIEIVSEEMGCRVQLRGLARDRADQLRIAAWHLSMAHCRAYATANVLAMRL